MSNIRLFGGLPKGLVSALPDSARTAPCIFRCLETSTKKELGSLKQVHLCLLQYSKQTPEGAGDYKLLEKRNQQNISDWELTHVSPEKTHPQKRFKMPPESLARLIGEDLSLYKASL